jgi:hypothetical protein
MYQFRREDMALQAARLLAVYERQPIVVMARGFMGLFTIGPIMWDTAELMGYRTSFLLTH